MMLFLLIAAILSDPKLPDELLTEIDAYALPRTITMRNPMTFAPFKVAKLKTGWKRSNSTEQGPGNVRVADEASKQRFSFTMQESDAAQWDVRCSTQTRKESVRYSGKKSSVDATMAGTTHLQCELVSTSGQSVWNLEWGATAEAQGLGMNVESSGRLTNGTSEFRVLPLFTVKDSRVLGDVPVGYTFRTPDGAVAAVHTVRPPGKFVLKRSVTGADRALLAAASSALLLNDRFATEVDLDD
jgi:hypothetical protein